MASAMSDPWVLFNRKLEEFAVDLCTTYAEVKEFHVLKNSVRLAAMMTPKLPQTIFHQHVFIPYEQHIINKNEVFFLEEDYASHLEGNSVNLDIVQQIKGIWKSLAPDQKEIIWKYMQVLVVLNRRCIA